MCHNYLFSDCGQDSLMSHLFSDCGQDSLTIDEKPSYTSLKQALKKFNPWFSYYIETVHNGCAARHYSLLLTIGHTTQYTVSALITG